MINQTPNHPTSNLSRRNFLKKTTAAGLAVGIGSPMLSAAKQARGEKIKALLVTGGGYHDYEAQKTIVTEGVSKLIDIDWTIWHHVKAEDLKKSLSAKGWADDYDVIVYNMCHANEDDESYINDVVGVHKAGKPCVAIHCTMHSYHWNVGGGKHSKQDKEWNKLLGVVSMRHGPRGPAITVKKSDVSHDAYKSHVADWTTPKGELYHIDKVYPSATVLAKGTNGRSEHPVVWVNKYGKANVFGTTIGHHNETMDSKDFLQTLADGIVWAVAETQKQA